MHKQLCGSGMFIPDLTFPSFSHPVSRVEKILDSRIRICIKEFEYFEPIKEKLISKFWLWFFSIPNLKSIGSRITDRDLQH
jgi:hypothetical protein